MTEYAVMEHSQQRELKSGKGLELSYMNSKITPYEVSLLNKLFWDRCKDLPYFKIVGQWPDSPACNIEMEEEIIVWFGWQLGEVRIGAIYNEKTKKFEMSTRKNATNIIKSSIGLSDYLANKYLNLSQSNFFDSFKRETLAQHWLWRADIDLRDYKNILTGIKDLIAYEESMIGVEVAYEEPEIKKVNQEIWR